ncbi:MAG: hypothetical protein JJT76_02470 [Clostridiaceae bacterium]|nr:hypothetical protein [Clostridiaceae bacterium]
MTIREEKMSRKQLVRNLEETLAWVEETEELQKKIREAYRVPYPISFKVNVLAVILLYMLYKNSGAIGGILLMGWIGWQLAVNVIYHMVRLRQRMPDIVRWKDTVNLNLEKLESHSAVPQKYWYSLAVQHFIKSIMQGDGDTIEECIAQVEV